MTLPLPVELRTNNLPLTYSAGSRTSLLPRLLDDRVCPTESVLEYIRIDLLHTQLAHTMTKLNL
jgi:hypothetical protein